MYSVQVMDIGEQSKIQCLNRKGFGSAICNTIYVYYLYIPLYTKRLIQALFEAHCICYRLQKEYLIENIAGNTLCKLVNILAMRRGQIRRGTAFHQTLKRGIQYKEWNCTNNCFFGKGMLINKFSAYYEKINLLVLR